VSSGSRDQLIGVRVTPEEMSTVTSLASCRGTTVAGYIREVLDLESSVPGGSILERIESKLDQVLTLLGDA